MLVVDEEIIPIITPIIIPNRLSQQQLKDEKLLCTKCGTSNVINAELYYVTNEDVELEAV